MFPRRSAPIKLLILLLPAAEQAQAAPPTNNYAASARSMASVSPTLVSVVGSRPSRISQQLEASSRTFRIEPGGIVRSDDGQAIPAGCPARPEPLAHQYVAGGVPAEPQLKGHAGNRGSNPRNETVRIGVSRTGPPSASSSDVLVDASFGPKGVYVSPRPCENGKLSDKARILDTAASLATASGNPFALAGNRSDLAAADKAHAEGLDIVLEAGPVSQ
ncbi:MULTISPECIES: hypothetical protein [Acetobacteraceae]|uniref:Uncharacterized protein n=3 Tax=Acetobacteraceae TaxID=433 RepID=A0A1D8UZ72_9PROT|nr:MULTISPECIES: hypothetical protein [Acetobacteraceae]GBR29410.1 hypothetical protein AA0488_1734 [Kozakia baliensis NRIC 0488]AOX18904.1 hypothetical protein A0U89_16580 [Kozakia baliensis]AOX21694.1 hypothetical protein A0U90_14415 [Kozakia baliensis]KXV51547.1 hypothetical protein AD944_01490 [Acetobacter tropicalis]GAL98716.1 hypothetical protein ATR1_421c0004 [Acetobacter tropicalis]